MWNSGTFLFLAGSISFYECTTIHSPIDGHLSCFQFGAIAHSSDMSSEQVVVRT